MTEVRVRVQVAGAELCTEWATPVDGLLALHTDVEEAVDGGLVLPWRFIGGSGGGRFVSGRHVEWFEVEVRRG